MVHQQEYIQAICPECGGDLQFREGKRKLACRDCKYTRNLSNRFGTQVQKKGLKERLNLNRFEKGGLDNIREYKCKKCKANLMVKSDQGLDYCPFCKSPDLDNNDRMSKVMYPFQIIPPTIPKRKVLKKLKKYLHPNFFNFLPAGISAAYEAKAVKGVFLPGFLFDINTRTSWKGEIGIPYNRKGRDGKNISGKNWDFKEGYFEKLFDNVLIMASKGADKGNVDAVPFDPSEAIKFDHWYMGEWVVELYDIEEIKSFDGAEKFVDGQIKRQAEYKIRSKKRHEFRKLEILSEKNCLTFRSVWLPVYITSFKYQGKNFQFMVNAQTGRIAGKRPISYPRVYITIGIVVALLLLLVLLVSTL